MIKRNAPEEKDYVFDTPITSRFRGNRRVNTAVRFTIIIIALIIIGFLLWHFGAIRFTRNIIWLD